MARRGPRTRLAPNIYRDGSGLAIKVRIGGKPKEIRFPASTPLPTLLRERDALKGRQQAAQPAAAGSLLADIEAYLRTVADPAKRQEQRMLCAHWLPNYGLSSRFALRPLVIRQQLAAWRRAGVAASTCNHRLSALRAVFRTVNEPDEPNYPAQVRRLPEPDPEPRAIVYDVIARILASMPDRGKPANGTRPPLSLTKWRLTLMAYTGLPPAQIKRIHPETDIDWQTPALRVRPRRKGKGTKEQWLPLLPQAVEALRVLADAGALPGPYSNHAVYKSWQAACVRVIREQRATGETPLPHKVLPDGRIRPLVRVYDLRHSFGTRALAISGDKAGVQRLMLHSSGSQTDRYVLAAFAERAAGVATLLAADLPELPKKKA